MTRHHPTRVQLTTRSSAAAADHSPGLRRLRLGYPTAEPGDDAAAAVSWSDLLAGRAGPTGALGPAGRHEEGPPWSRPSARAPTRRAIPGASAPAPPSAATIATARVSTCPVATRTFPARESRDSCLERPHRAGSRVCSRRASHGGPCSSRTSPSGTGLARTSVPGDVESWLGARVAEDKPDPIAVLREGSTSSPRGARRPETTSYAFRRERPRRAARCDLAVTRVDMLPAFDPFVARRAETRDHSLWSSPGPAGRACRCAAPGHSQAPSPSRAQPSIPARGTRRRASRPYSWFENRGRRRRELGGGCRSRACECPSLAARVVEKPLSGWSPAERVSVRLTTRSSAAAADHQPGLRRLCPGYPTAEPGNIAAAAVCWSDLLAGAHSRTSSPAPASR